MLECAVIACHAARAPADPTDLDGIPLRRQARCAPLDVVVVSQAQACSARYPKDSLGAVSSTRSPHELPREQAMRKVATRIVEGREAMRNLKLMSIFFSKNKTCFYRVKRSPANFYVLTMNVFASFEDTISTLLYSYCHPVYTESINTNFSGHVRSSKMGTIIRVSSSSLRGEKQNFQQVKFAGFILIYSF